MKSKLKLAAAVMKLQFIFQVLNLTPVYSILGGYNITISEAPFHVNYGDICGAVLVHSKWALTTAHCGIDSTYIRIGSRHRLRGPKVRVLSHIIHPEYGLEHTYDYDVQLLKVRSLHFRRTVRSIKISDGECGEYIYVAGWGYPMEKGDYQEYLQQVCLRIVPIESCQNVKEKWYNNTLTSRMFCAGGWGQDACQGDSGGAAVSYGQIVGISSFGFGCGRNLPGVYINVSNTGIRKWISAYTGV